MAVYEGRRQSIRRNEPSFSSSLLDAIYRSIDQVEEDLHLHREKKNAAADEDAESLRRTIMIDKWIDSYSRATTTCAPRHLPSNSSSSSTESSMFFSSTETESSVSKPKSGPTPFKNKTKKSRAQKIYGDLKKVKEPISPGGKIASFLNSIFSPRSVKTSQAGPEEWSHSVIKSRSVNHDTKSTRSCLSTNQFTRGTNNNYNNHISSNKSKRSVRFCPVEVIVNEDYQPHGHKTIYSNPHSNSSSAIGSQYIKKNMDSLRKHELRDRYYYNQKKENDFDDMSCASSDLFELENIGRAGGRRTYEEEDDELPVYGTTSFKMNHKVFY